MAILDFRKNDLYFEEVTDGYSRNPTIPLPNDNGELTVYNYVLHLPNNCREFQYGERVRVAINGGTERVYSVVGFQRGQLQCKLYIKATQ